MESVLLIIMTSLLLNQSVISAWHCMYLNRQHSLISTKSPPKYSSYDSWYGLVCLGLILCVSSIGNTASDSDDLVLLVLPEPLLEPKDRSHCQNPPASHLAAQISHLRLLLSAAQKWISLPSLLQVHSRNLTAILI